VADAAVAGERVSILWRVPTTYTPPSRERVAQIEYDELEDDDAGFWADMMEKSPSEFFVDHIVWPLLGTMIAALLILVITGAVWLSVRMGVDIKAMLA
jgi:hypothetical protein